VNATPNPLPNATPQATAVRVANGRGLWLFSTVFVVLLAAAGYAWKGTPAFVGGTPPQVAAAVPAQGAPGEAVAQAPGDAANSAGSDVLPGGMQRDQFVPMVEGLKKRLESEPDNAVGWAMLARSYALLGDVPQSVAAFDKATKLAPNDAALIADHAHALSMTDQMAKGAPSTLLLARALSLDPNQPKALMLTGSAAFERQDYAAAVVPWERMLSAHPDHPMAPQLREGVTEARRMAGLPPGAAPSQGNAPSQAMAPSSAASNGQAGNANARITGTASLAPDIAAKAAPDDTVFVFARAVEGSRMPLAIVRKQVKDLPLAFTLDDSTAMSPQNKLSSQTQVVVGVRVSKRGDAMPQPGDLQTISKPVAVGTQGLQIVVSDVVKP
jgi:cytochrome c-type biogenesis protein CcmH